MKVNIKINCDTIRELKLHLTVLQEQINKESKRLGLNKNEDGFSPESGEMLSDSNCYGEHRVNICDATELPEPVELPDPETLEFNSDLRDWEWMKNNL